MPMIADVVRAALGEVPCDLLLKNCRLVNVYSEEIYQTNIAIKGRYIASICSDEPLPAMETLDCAGLYAIPGLMDAHVHIEATMLTLEALASLIVPQGTTAIFIDPMEIANVAGLEGVRALLAGVQGVPLRLFLEVPSRVPTAPALETTGASLGLSEVQEMLCWKEAVSLGEMDPTKIIPPQEEYLGKIEAARSLRKIVNGHAIGLKGSRLNAYTAAGIADDHECVTAESLIERLRLGLRIMVREGSTERNLSALLRGVQEGHFDYRHLIFCTDDKHASDISSEGHISYNVKKAIKEGVPPTKAIQMATLNIAEHFRLADLIGSITPGRLADIVLVENLRDLKPGYVLVDGRVVAKDGRLVRPLAPSAYPSWLRNTVKLLRPITPQSFILPSDGTEADVRVIALYPDQIINREERATLPVRGGAVRPSPEKDVLKLVVVERYGKNGNVAIAFVRGFGLRKGVLASSVAHDHHNLIAVGCDDEDLAAAINALVEMQGGFVVVKKGKVLASLPLPLAGLMSDQEAETVIAQSQRLNQAAAELGCQLPAPFMTLSFISLPTVPELGITDRGLVDVVQHRIINIRV
ncbi:MAG: adenine deaminase [Chloroflexi bacterium]|nr:adenine deaminase [Chloroflexota bacterium]MCL5076467.1 adenine deaminase [Chloroflexota bacterium]